MSEHVGKTVVEKGDEEALQAYLDEVEQAVRDTWDGEWSSKDANVETYVVPTY